jgi:hypothetical protein
MAAAFVSGRQISDFAGVALALVLYIYCWPPARGPMYDVNRSVLRAFRQTPGNECFFLNAARPTVPKYLLSLNPDLVVFDSTFMLYARLDSDNYTRMTELVRFVRDSPASKVILSSDEQVRSDWLVTFIEDFGVSHVFTYANPEARALIFRGVDPERVVFHKAMPGYVDERHVRRISRLAKRSPERPIDVGARLRAHPTTGRHGQLRSKVIEIFAERAPRAGFSVDLSAEHCDDWFRFLLGCRYSLGIEAGTSLLDRDGSIRMCVDEYLATHENPSFEEVEAVCFPGLDGNIDCLAIGQRDLWAVMTKTCLVAIEGEYSGVLRPGEHYIELKRDFSNIEQVLKLMKDEDLRVEIVERAYRDVVASGRYSLQAFATTAVDEVLRGLPPRTRPHWTPSLMTARNQLDERLLYWTSGAWKPTFWRVRNAVLSTLRPIVSRAIGEDRLRRLLALVRNDVARP